MKKTKRGIKGKKGSVLWNGVHVTHIQEKLLFY